MFKKVIVTSGRHSGKVGLADFSFAKTSGTILFLPSKGCSYQIILPIQKVRLLKV